MAIYHIEDWGKFPSAVVHKETKNKSWIRMAGLLMRMGVKNNDFFLCLLNPLLRNVDPHSPNLTIEQKQMVALECKLNPWYYFRECFVVKYIGIEPVLMNANRLVIANIWLCFQGVNNYEEAPRQIGKTVSITGNLSYVSNTASDNYDLGVLTKNSKLQNATANSIKDNIENLPKYLNMQSPSDVRSSERITVKSLNNTIYLQITSDSVQRAINIYRGFTLPIFSGDEVAFLQNLQHTLPTVLAATSTANDLAEEHNTHHYIQYGSTAGRLDSKEGDFVYTHIYKKCLRFTERMYDLGSKSNLKEYVSNGSSINMVLVSFTHDQLGFTDKWLADRRRVYIGTDDEFANDYLNQWMRGSTHSIIDNKIRDRMLASKIKETNDHISGYGFIFSWIVNDAYLKDKTVVFGVDTSDMLGEENDSLSVIAIDATTGEVLGGNRYNLGNIGKMSGFLVELLELNPRSIMIMERRSSASAIMDNMFILMLDKGMNPYLRMYNKLINNVVKNKAVIYRPSLTNLTANKKQFGYTTSKSGENSRDMLYFKTFKIAMNSVADKVRLPILIDDILALTVRDGRIDHETGGHDDTVIGYLLAMWFILQDIDVLKYYSITKKFDYRKNEQDQDTKHLDAETMRRLSSTDSLIRMLKSIDNKYGKDDLSDLIKGRVRFLISKIDIEVLKMANRLNDIELINMLAKKTKRN